MDELLEAWDTDHLDAEDPTFFGERSDVKLRQIADRVGKLQALDDDDSRRIAKTLQVITLIMRMQKIWVQSQTWGSANAYATRWKELQAFVDSDSHLALGKYIPLCAHRSFVIVQVQFFFTASTTLDGLTRTALQLTFKLDAEAADKEQYSFFRYGVMAALNDKGSSTSAVISRLQRTSTALMAQDGEISLALLDVLKQILGLLAGVDSAYSSTDLQASIYTTYVCLDPPTLQFSYFSDSE